MSAKTDKVSGRLKKAAGSLSGDRKLEAEGETQEKGGTIKEKINHVVDKVTKK